MRIRTIGLRALAAVAVISVGLAGPVTVVGAVDLGVITLGDLIQMPKDCLGEPFAHAHVFDGVSVEIDEFEFPDPATNPYVHDTSTYGLGTFTVEIHCEPQADHHDPTTTFEYTYEFVVIAPVVAATTTIAIIPATGAASTTSVTLIATFALLAGAGLLLARRRSLG